MLTRLSTTQLQELHNHIVLHLQHPFDAGPERIRFLTLALAGEAGEMANNVKKEWRGDDIDRAQWLIKLKSELADIGNYVFMLAEALDIDLPHAMLTKLIEVEQRPWFTKTPQVQP